MKKIVWKNKSNNQLCVTIPSSSEIKEGDIVEIKKTSLKRIAYLPIVGDLFHYGHLHAINFAKSISDYLVCGVLTDEAAEEIRVRPIANLKERKAVISELRPVDRVLIQTNIDPTSNLKKIHAEYKDAEIHLIYGSDWKEIPAEKYLSEIGGKVIRHPYYSRLSGFKIIDKLIENRNNFKDIIDFSDIIKNRGKVLRVLNRKIISTKANTLMALKPILTKSKIEDIFILTSIDWANNKDKVIEDIQKKFQTQELVVRSSAISEDSIEDSKAGHFESVLNIKPNKENITSAVNRVFSSYKKKNSISSSNQVLVQNYSKNIVMSGVVFTRTLRNAPYYVINYDDKTGATDTVTHGIETKTTYILRTANPNEKLRNLMESVYEIEKIVPGIGLDIEFGINSNNEVIIFQVRPLTLSLKSDTNDKTFFNLVKSIKQEHKKLSIEKEHLSGKANIFADMPDWNPAEIIGDKPNILDYSLYDYLITGSAWHEARTSQGYNNVSPAKLVILFGSKPYVDVRNTFNSFIPAKVPRKLRDKLVSFYLKKLDKNHDMQDKVEFEILFTCYDMNFDNRKDELINEGFSSLEIQAIKTSLIELTNNLITNSKKTIKNDLNDLETLDKNRKRIVENLPLETSFSQHLKKAKFLLDDARKLGTVQFSRLARLAFIGKIMLKSMVIKNILTKQEYHDFMNSISTVATEINVDFKKFCSGEVSKDEFIKKYCHLRPGTYDITSLRYDSNPDLLKSMNFSSVSDKKYSFRLSEKTAKKITDALLQEGLEFSAYDLFEFSRKAIEAREFSKFEFTKNLSDALEIIANVGENMGFTRKELSLLELKDIFIEKQKEELLQIWKERIEKNSQKRLESSLLVLPPIITREQDFEIITPYKPRPNYITNKKVQGLVIKLNDKEVIPEIDDKIVLIESGDPGYDWIFTRKIKGLVTKYGGVASHMSIRSAEFGIPAAIGAGYFFDHLNENDFITLDCEYGRIIK